MKIAGVVLSVALLFGAFGVGGFLSDRKHAEALAETRDSVAVLTRGISAAVTERDATIAYADTLAVVAARSIAAAQALASRPAEVVTLYRCTDGRVVRQAEDCPQDDGPAVPIPVVAAAVHDELRRACNRLAEDCTAAIAAKDSALSRGLIAHARERARGDYLQERLDALARAPRRFGVGCSAGLGAVASDGQLRSGWGVTCGVNYSLR